MIKRAIFFRLLLLGTILAQISMPVVGLAHPALQELSPQERAAALLDGMTPEERVGQLFLVEFQGTNIEPGSPLADLITNWHIGGVSLVRANDNFQDTEGMLSAIRELDATIQRTEWNGSTSLQVNRVTNETFNPVFVPLFIAIAQDGDGYPNDQILSGLTPVPSPMAIGASWRPGIAFDVGEILGKELQAVGINLYLGPSLDVAESPRPDRSGDLGNTSFGGSPYWVGVMGQSFVSGLHTGSDNRMLVAAKHFPGHSGSDRPHDEEIPFIRKNLQQLIASEFAPFIAVTGSATSRRSTVDAVVLTHAKYQGLQGNLQPSTYPISFDPEGFEELVNLQDFSLWRNAGGVIISDDLGTRAVRRFFDPTERVFNARLVALKAFISGNDLLYLGKFVGDGDPDSYTTISNTLDFFARKYREDPVFAQRVDEAVLKILAMKYKIYNEFTLNEVLQVTTALSEIGRAADVAIQAANSAASLISPNREDLNSVLPSPPNQNEKIIIFTDTYNVQQCSICPQQPALDLRALEQAIVRLYGPQSTAQIFPQNIRSYSFEELDLALDLPENDDNLVLEGIKAADWILVLNLDSDLDRAASQAFQHFLSERPDLLQARRTIVFALDAPYFLDASDISKITTYYGLYSKQPQFVELAARIIFKEVAALGASPVSIIGIDYDLAEATSPDPRQTFAFFLYRSGEKPEEGDEASQTSELKVGDSITLETGIIVDHNKNPVPDLTPVRLLLTTTTTEGITNQREILAATQGGRIKANAILENSGILAVEATSGEPPARSLIIQVDVVANSDSDSTQVALGNPPSGIFGGNEGAQEIRPDKTTFGDWLLILMVTGFVGLFAYQSGSGEGEVRWGIRWALSAVIGGLLVNVYLSFGLPGSLELIKGYRVWGIAGTAGLGASIGWIVGWVWRRMSRST